jgi:sulfatase maturation enzyme AslB (radical SAM superfamily)
MTELYCPYIWKELFIENDGYVSPCLNSTNKLFDTSITHQNQKVNVSQTQIHQHLDGLVEMRENMKKGIWPKQCINCQVKESKNLKSHRVKALETYADTNTVELKHLILRVGNICNLKCVMCGPWASNQWYNDYVELNNSTEFKNNQQTYTLDKKLNGDYYIKNSPLNADRWENVLETILNHSNELETISFHGGEPMVSKLHYKIIAELIKLKKSSGISLEYYTNFFQIPDQFFDTIDNFKQVTLNISLDGVGEINDAVRWPSKYTEIEQNIQRIKSKINVELKINHTISILNCEHIIDFITHNLDFGINLNFVSEPLYSSVKLLDMQHVEQLKEMLKSKNYDLYQTYKIDELITSLRSVSVGEQNKQHHRQLFTKMWDQFSTKQNQNWKELFPFAYKLYKEWSNN